MDDATLLERQKNHFILQTKLSSVPIFISVAEFLNNNFPER